MWRGIPSASRGGYRSYLGEHPWLSRLALEESNLVDDWIVSWYPRAAMSPPVNILPTTARYRAESTGYDASIEGNIELNLPAGWLMDSLGIRLDDGKTITYVDADGNVRFKDPSVEIAGGNAALVDREAFIAMLERESLAIVWAISGEKNVYGEGESRGFGGRMSFTRILHTDGSDITALVRFLTFDKPSTEQLEQLYSVQASADPEA